MCVYRSMQISALGEWGEVKLTPGLIIEYEYSYTIYKQSKFSFFWEKCQAKNTQFFISLADTHLKEVKNTQKWANLPLQIEWKGKYVASLRQHDLMLCPVLQATFLFHSSLSVNYRSAGMMMLYPRNPSNTFGRSRKDTGSECILSDTESQQPAILFPFAELP